MFSKINIIISFLFFIAGNIIHADIHVSEKYTAISHLALSIKLFDNMLPESIAFPDAYRKGNTEIKGYKTEEMWKYKQTFGYWKNNYSEIIAAQAKYSPEILNTIFLEKSEIKKFFDLDVDSVKWTENEVEKWLKAFLNLESVKHLTKYELDSDTIVDFFYAETKNHWFFTSVYSDRNNSKPLIILSFKVNRSIDKKTAAKEVFKSVNSLKKIDSNVINTRVIYLDKGSRKNIGNDNTLKVVLNSISNQKGWNILAFSNYYIVTDCDVKNTSDGFLKFLTETLENGLKIYSYFYPEKSKISEKCVVRVFKDRAGYVSYVGEDLKWSGGLWMARKKELVLTKADFTFTERNRFIRVLKHEAFHQYIHYAADEVVSSVWFNEGNAQFFENVSYVDGRIFIKPVGTKLDYIKEHLKDKDLSSKLSVLLKKSYNEFYDQTQAEENYNLSWAIVYFINCGSRIINEKYKRNYSDILEKYYRNLLKLYNSDKANKEAWKDVDIKQFTKDLIFYYKVYARNSNTKTVNVNKKK